MLIKNPATHNCWTLFFQISFPGSLILEIETQLTMQWESEFGVLWESETMNCMHYTIRNYLEARNSVHYNYVRLAAVCVTLEAFFSESLSAKWWGVVSSWHCHGSTLLYPSLCWWWVRLDDQRAYEKYQDHIVGQLTSVMLTHCHKFCGSVAESWLLADCKEPSLANLRH